jgi:diphosphomevalonate decarboxylase
MTAKTTATAHSNIALVKYWGKRDDARVLPHQSSLSLTLAPLAVTATIAFGGDTDIVEINGEQAQGSARRRVVELLDRVRRECSSDPGSARVATRGNFPMSAGLASSAAAFAALAIAARGAAGLDASVQKASILARHGSGSACRSIQGGFCLWRRGDGESGEDSYAEQLFDEMHWPDLRMIAAVVSREEKPTPSRDGMRNTVMTSPFYPAWIADAEADARHAATFLERRDLEGLGELAERSAWRMHATAIAADPPLCYLLPSTLAVIHAVAAGRRAGLPLWFTLDAGPNPVILTDAQHEAEACALALDNGAIDVVACRPGGDARIDSVHLF